MTLRDNAEELSGHFHVIRTKLLGVVKYNPATSSLLNVQESHLLLDLGTRGPITMSAVARELQLSLSSATAVVDKLEEKALVRRERDPQDRRIVNVALTDEGSKLFQLLQEARLTAVLGILKTLSPDEQEVLLGLFRKIAAKLDDERSTDASGG